MNAPKCPERVLLLSVALGDPDSPDLAAHVQACPRCQAEVKQLQEAAASLRNRQSLDLDALSTGADNDPFRRIALTPTTCDEELPAVEQQPALAERAAGTGLSHPGWRVAFATLSVVAVASVIALAAWRPWAPMAPQRGDRIPTPDLAPEPVRVKALQVLHEARVEGGAEERGALGDKSFETRFNDLVKITVTLSKPGHAYLLAFNPDGKEQLLWPVGEDLKPNGQVAPPLQDRVEYPVRPGKRLYLNDNPQGGLQAFAVVVSSQALPPFETWRKARGPAPWAKLPPARGVWASDGAEVYPMIAGAARRSTEGDLPNAPPLRKLGQFLQAAPVETVEILAFPVRAKEDNP